jgi:triosephosphate isomerase (TIM)
LTRPLIVGNWKMNKSIGQAVDFVSSLKVQLKTSHDRDVVIAPPFTALRSVANVCDGSPIAIAAQNLHDQESGAYTGEVSAMMVADAGCRYVILGHSERRTLFLEDDFLINRKIRKALAYQLCPIFCVGETLQERESETTFKVIEKQIKEGLNNLTTDDIERLVIAYEPVWAIGTGKTATPVQAGDVHAGIRRFLSDNYNHELARKLRLIYGGSVTPDNIEGLMEKPDINGVLVGGASLEVESFLKIIMH